MFKDLFEGKKLITFDLDGTTVRSEKAWDMAIREAAKDAGMSLFSTGTIGITLEKRWEQIFTERARKIEKSAIDDLSSKTKAFYLTHLDKVELVEGFWDIVAELKLLKKIPLALVTTTPRSITEKVLEKMDIKEVYDFIICGNEVRSPKPDPEIYKKTLDHFKVPAKNSLAFEDSLAGCTAAAKADIKVICVWDGLTPQKKFPDEVVGYTQDFTPFRGEIDTTYKEDIVKMAEEEKQRLANKR